MICKIKSVSSRTFLIAMFSDIAYRQKLKNISDSIVCLSGIPCYYTSKCPGKSWRCQKIISNEAIYWQTTVTSESLKSWGKQKE